MLTSRLALGLGLALTLLASSAAAAPTPKERAEAKTAWARGKSLTAQKQFEDAVASLRRAHDLDPKVQYKLDLARALIETKQLVEASERLSEIAASSEPNVQKAKSVAAKLKTEVDARIPSITAKVSGPGASSATITIDGVTVEPGKANKLDPGTRIVVARGSAGQEARERVDLAEGQQHSVLLALPEATKGEEREVASSGGGTMVPAAILYAIGGAGLVTGGVLGGLAFSKTASVEEVCGGTVCPPQYTADIAEAQDLGTGSTIAFAVGGLSVVAGFILTFTVGMDDGEPEPEAKSVVIRPIVSPDFIGVGGAF